MKKFIKMLGNGLLFTPLILMGIAFKTAWFNPSKSVEIFINNYNEMYLDLICLTIILVFGLWALILNIIDYFKD